MNASKFETYLRLSSPEINPICSDGSWQSNTRFKMMLACPALNSIVFVFCFHTSYLHCIQQQIDGALRRSLDFDFCRALICHQRKCDTTEVQYSTLNVISMHAQCTASFCFYTNSKIFQKMLSAFSMLSNLNIRISKMYCMQFYDSLKI